ncbi:MAG: hypothetical protein ACR2FL_06255 [Nocardioidaceae bacterium]
MSVPSAAASVSSLLAAYNPEDVKPGWLGFSVVMALIVALAVLMRSFAKQLKRVDFDEDADPSAAEPEERSDDR